MHELITHQDLPTVLLVDDDLVSREVAATVLTLSGYTVYTAESGEGALDRIGEKSCNPAVILIDAQMPGLGGKELIKALRAQTRATVIVVSGSRPPEEVMRAADGFLLKPFDAVALESALEKPNGASRAAARHQARVADRDPILSPETLAQLRSLMSEEGIREVYTSVTTDLEKRMIELERAIASRDMAAVRRIGHAIKGGCGMAGALQAARLGAMLEALPDEPGDNHLDNSTEILKNLRSATRNLERILTSELPV